jgi:hypothetical protein
MHTTHHLEFDNVCHRIARKKQVTTSSTLIRKTCILLDHVYLYNAVRVLKVNTKRNGSKNPSDAHQYITLSPPIGFSSNAMTPRHQLAIQSTKDGSGHPIETRERNAAAMSIHSQGQERKGSDYQDDWPSATSSNQKDRRDQKMNVHPATLNSKYKRTRTQSASISATFFIR